MKIKSVFLYSRMVVELYNQLKKAFPYLQENLLKEMYASCEIKVIPLSTQIVRIGQYINVIPIVLNGVIKVLSQKDEKELLLYYIKPNESCVMSFASAFNNTPSPIFALVEEEATVLLLPVPKLLLWLKKYPEINSLFYHQYNQRYQDLLETIHHIVNDTLEVRVFDYLKNKKTVFHLKEIKISHKQIASDLGTAREVVSRIIKKLENEGKLIQHTNSIIIC